jgi:translation initiation factor 1A
MSSQNNIKRGGKRAKKMKNHVTDLGPRELILKDDMQEYAVIEKVLGNNRYTARCFDNKSRLAHKRGNMNRGATKTVIALGDYILVSLRDYQDSKCDVIHVYSDVEIRRLKQINELPFDDTNNSKVDEEEVSFDFGSI